MYRIWFRRSDNGQWNAGGVLEKEYKRKGMAEKYAAKYFGAAEGKPSPWGGVVHFEWVVSETNPWAVQR